MPQHRQVLRLSRNEPDVGVIALPVDMAVLTHEGNNVCGVAAAAVAVVVAGDNPDLAVASGCMDCGWRGG